MENTGSRESVVTLVNNCDVVCSTRQDCDAPSILTAPLAFLHQILIRRCGRA